MKTEMLKPGPMSEPDSDPGTWNPTGKADGVFFLGEVAEWVTLKSGATAKRVLVASLEREALSYLRPVSEAWKARHPGFKGMCRPSVPFLAPPKLVALAKANEQPITWLFASDTDQAINANQPQHVQHWKLYEVQEGIWCVFYEPPTISAK